MQCRHTVPDWHRYVDPAGDALPIFAACRLLAKDGERARDPRSIACIYWGHQRDCPLFEGLGGAAETQPRAAERAPSRDMPVAVDTVWPVRAPGAREGMRLVLIGLGAFSSVMMLLAAGVLLSLIGGRTSPAGYLHLMLAAVTISVVTHILATLRAWAGR
jgi:hypothetical protein